MTESSTDVYKRQEQPGVVLHGPAAVPGGQLIQYPQRQAHHWLIHNRPVGRYPPQGEMCIRDRRSPGRTPRTAKQFIASLSVRRGQI